MRLAWKINRALIVFFALSSGVYKVSFGAADIEVYANLNYSPGGTAIFGALQALCGIGCLFERTRLPAALAYTAFNAVATSALFAAGEQPFGWISWIFVLMAALVAFKPGDSPNAPMPQEHPSPS